MAELTVGRLGFDFDFDNPNQIRSRVDRRRHRVELRGQIAAGTLPNTKALRSELEQHVVNQDTVAVTLADDAFIDGYYKLTDVSIEAEDYALNSTGLFDFSLSMERLGTAQAVMALSKIDGLLIANDYTVIESEAKYTWCPPIGAEAVRDAGNPNTGHERATPDGDIRVYIGVDPDLDPTYSVDPADYYKGAAEITLGGYVRSGLDAPEDLTGWKISTGVVDLFADGVNDGVINLQHSVDQTPYGFEILFNSVTAIPAWNYPSIEYNTPEVCVLTLTRDANEADPTDHTHFLEITARRGFPFFYCRFVWTGNAVAWSVDREATDAATSITPTGADGAMAIEDSANDGDGNRWFLGSANTTTKDTTTGGLDWAATNEITFILGIEIDGSAANASDDTGDLMLQALASLGEFVEFRRR